MLTKTNFVFPLFLIVICFLFACEKEAIVDPGSPPSNIPDDSSKYEGMFYGLMNTSEVELPPSDFDNEADQILRIYVENDSIKVLNFVFPIDSLSQTHFNASSIPSPNSYANTKILTLTYSTDYKNIVLEYDYSCYYGPINGCTNSTLDFDGIRTTQSESVLPHSDSSNLVGSYNLSVRIKDTQTNQDTQYVGTVVVNTLGNAFKFDQKSLYLGTFHNFRDYNFSSAYSSSGYIYNRDESKNVYWLNDSLSIQYSSIVNNNGVKDTLYYSYVGRKQ